MSLYYLVVPGTIYIRNFCDRGDAPLGPHTCFPTSVQRMEVTLIPDKPTNLEHLIQFTRDVFSSNVHSLTYSKSTPFHYVAQIDWSLLQNQYHNINNLVDSLSHHHNLNYHLAFTNIIPGGEGFRNAELYVTSTGGTAGTRLKLPLHGFSNDGLVTYLSASIGLPSLLTEICVEDTTSLDATMLSQASRNLVRLLEARVNDIQRATFSTTLPHIHTLIPQMQRLYDLTFTQPESNATSSFPTSELEQNILTSLLPASSSYNTASRISSPASRSSTISILTLPAHLFISPVIRNRASRLRRLQELRIVLAPSDAGDFGHLPVHRAGDFAYLRCLTFEGGTIPQFVSLLPTLFPSPFYSSSARSSISSSPRLSVSPSHSSFTSSQRSRKFINLTLFISSLSSSSSLTQVAYSINTYIPHGIDIFKLHVREWGVDEPKSGAWWTKAGVCVRGGRGGSSVKHGRALGLVQLPGRVMADLAHPCREEIGSRAKAKKKSKVKRLWREIVESTRGETRIMHSGGVSESGSTRSFGSKVSDLKGWWERWWYSKVALPVER